MCTLFAREAEPARAALLAPTAPACLAPLRRRRRTPWSPTAFPATPTGHHAGVCLDACPYFNDIFPGSPGPLF